MHHQGEEGEEGVENCVWTVDHVRDGFHVHHQGEEGEEGVGPMGHGTACTCMYSVAT